MGVVASTNDCTHSQVGQGGPLGPSGVRLVHSPHRPSPNEPIAGRRIAHWGGLHLMHAARCVVRYSANAPLCSVASSAHRPDLTRFGGLVQVPAIFKGAHRHRDADAGMHGKNNEGRPPLAG